MVQGIALVIFGKPILLLHASLPMSVNVSPPTIHTVVTVAKDKAMNGHS